jgi:choline dehydrogenase-like flavoprotein
MKEGKQGGSLMTSSGQTAQYNFILAGGGSSACVAATRLVRDFGCRVLILERSPMAVLDHRMRVRGIENLRVIDCSAIPFIPSANTNAAASMLGHRAAEFAAGAVHHPAKDRQYEAVS